MKKFTLSLLALVGMVFNANAAVTVDDICGAYEQNIEFEWYDYENYTVTGKVVITKVDDTNITIQGFWGGPETINATFDAEAQTISIPSYQSVSYADYTWSLYGVTYANSSAGEICTLSFGIDTTDGVVLTALSQPTLGYDYYGTGEYYDYSYYGKATLTRVGEVKETIYTGNVTVDLYTDEGEIDKNLYTSKEVLISEYENGICDLKIANWCGNGQDLLLTIDEEEGVIIHGGDEYNGYSYYYYVTTDIDCLSPYYEEGEMEIIVEEDDVQIIVPFTYWTNWEVEADGSGIAIINYSMTQAPQGLKGDANADDKVTMADANLVVNAYTTGDINSIASIDNADVTGEGEITMADANGIVNLFVGE